MKRALLSVALLGVLAPAAHAERKKLSTAQAISGVGTGASAAVFLTAILLAKQNSGEVNLPLVFVGLGSSVITPSLGHWYAGRYITVGLGVRAAAAGVAAWGVLNYQQTVRCNTFEYMECKNLKGGAMVVLGISAIAFVGGAAYDFKTLGESVDSYNARFALTPTIMPTTSGPPGAGLVLSGEF